MAYLLNENDLSYFFYGEPIIDSKLNLKKII